MNTIRWWLFKKLSALGWWVCPEPQRSTLNTVFDATWQEVRAILEKKP